MFDYLTHPYPSRRTNVFARNGMVATSQPLAAEAGMQVLRTGGNAIDAAIACAACLTVLEPTSNGIGGDAFALVWTKGKLHGLNASGPAPRGLSIDRLQESGVSEIPDYGWIPVTVPGAPAAWAALSAKFGSLPLTEVLKPAIRYAEEGFPVSPTLGLNWKIAYDLLSSKLQGEMYRTWFETFAPDGRAPAVGEMWRSEKHADTLRSIAESNAESFYRGELAEKIDAFSRSAGGYLRYEDLAAYEPLWVEPISIDYRGHRVWEIPPNGQGLVAIMALNMLKGFDFSSKDDAETYHRQIEAMKLAFADGKRYIADPGSMAVRADELLSDGYAASRRSLISDHALFPEAGNPPKGGTVYLAAADKDGNMVSFIQSNYEDFGSGLVVPGTGINLQNRGRNFSMDPNHDNSLQPGKRPYHTIIPGFMTKDNVPVGPFGVMGGFMQPQGHVQVIMNMIDFGLSPQAALDAPRWQWTNDKTVLLERGVPEHIAQQLGRRGHDVKIALDSGTFGRGQIIRRDPDTGVLVGGTEPRTDGCVAAW